MIELRAVCDRCGEGGPVLDGEACTPGDAIVAAGLIHEGDLLVHPEHDVMSEDEQHAVEFRDPVEAEKDREVFARLDLLDAHHDWVTAIDPEDHL